MDIRAITRKILSLTVIALVSLIFFEQRSVEQKYKEQMRYSQIEENAEYGVIVAFYDENNDPVAPFGYSVVEKTINEFGKVVFEKYYLDGLPTTSINGQYGTIFKYDENGNQSIISFVDENGNPINGINGYASCRRSFYDDGTLKDERYYDTEDLPVKNADGHYGVRHKREKIVYLDADGRESFDLSLF